MSHAVRLHARKSASRTERFMACPGSFLLEQQVPEPPPGEAAATGTAIHELAEKFLNGMAVHEPDHPDEHIDKARQYVDYVEGLCERPRRRLIEFNVDAGLKTLHPDLGGTADAVLVSEDGKALHVIDLKTGRIPVDATEHLPMLTYALGVVRMFKAPRDIAIHLHIVQPGVGISTWATDMDRLDRHAEELQAAALLADSPDAPTNPSPKACRYCRAKAICPSMRQRVQDSARKDFAPDTTVTPEMLDLADIATQWAEAVQEAAKAQLRADKPIPGWTLRAGRKTRFWKAEAMARDALKDHPEAFDLKSPSAIQKLGIEVSDELVGEKQASESLVRSKKNEQN